MRILAEPERCMKNEKHHYLEDAEVWHQWPGCCLLTSPFPPPKVFASYRSGQHSWVETSVTALSTLALNDYYTLYS